MGRRRTIDDERILAAARDVILTRGAGVSTRAIARAAGISEAVIRGRYGSRDALFFAAMAQAGLRVDDLLGSATELDWQQSPAEARRYLIVVTERMIEAFRSFAPVLWQVLAYRAADDEGLLYRWQRASPVAALLTELGARLGVLAGRGVITVDDPQRAAEILAASAFAVTAFGSSVVPGRTVFAADGARSPAEAIVDDLWNGVAPRGMSALRAPVERVPTLFRASDVSAADVEARTAGALAVAVDAARAFGLDVRAPRVVHVGTFVLVHVAPAPVAVRVRVKLPPGMRDAGFAAHQQRELDVVAWLSAQRLPVIAPSSLVPVSPVVCDGCSMTFWTMADVADADGPPNADSATDVAMLVELHAAMRECPAAKRLPFLASVNLAVPLLLARLDAMPGLLDKEERRRAFAEWEALSPVIASGGAFRWRFRSAAIQAVHGDDPMRHVIRTTAGPRFTGFEHVMLAPPEWDLALSTQAEASRYDHEAWRRQLPGIDWEVLPVMRAVRMLEVVARLALVPDVPMLADDVAPVLAKWQGMPFAGGL